MKLFNKTIDNKLFKQYSFGSDLSKQKVVAKIFNPYGRGTWYILNSDPNDPDYLWAIVDLGYGAEVGSVSRSELETYKNKMGWGFERDMYFYEINAKELYNGLLNGESYDNGGDVSNDVYEVKHSKENNTYQVWKSDFLVTDFVTKKEADAVAKRLNSLYSYDNGGETNDLEIGQKYRAKNGDILTIKDFDVEDHVTTDDGKGKMSSMGIQRISVFKELIKDGELVHLSENGSEISSREQFINKEIKSQKEKEKDQNFKLFRVNVYEQNENKGAYPFVEPYHTDNFVEALNFAKETIKKQRSYRSNSGTLWTTIDSFTPIEKRENVRYPYSELIRFDEKNINTSKFNNGGYMTDPNFGDFQNGVYAEGGGISVDDLKTLNAYWDSYYKGVMAGKKDEGYTTIRNEEDLHKYITNKLGSVVKSIELIEKGKSYPYNFSNPYKEDTYSVTLKDGTKFRIVRSYGKPRYEGNVDYKEQIIVEKIQKFANGGNVGNNFATGGGVGEKYLVDGDRVLNTETNMYVDYDFETKERAEDFAKTKNDRIKKHGVDYATGGEVSFIDYKDSEIMYEPNYKKYYANDVEFDSLQEAKDFLDSGEIDPSIRDAYKRGLFETGGYMTDPNFGDFQSGVYKYGGEVEYAIKGYKQYTEKLWKGDDYFSEKYAVNELAELELDLRKLNDGYLSPSKVVGKGYKNAKKVAQDWLNEQIKKQKSIIETRGLSNRTNQSNFRSELRFALNENIISEEKFNTLLDESNEIIDSLGETYATGGGVDGFKTYKDFYSSKYLDKKSEIDYVNAEAYIGSYKVPNTLLKGFISNFSTTLNFFKSVTDDNGNYVKEINPKVILKSFKEAIRQWGIRSNYFDNKYNYVAISFQKMMDKLYDVQDLSEIKIKLDNSRSGNNFATGGGVGEKYLVDGDRVLNTETNMYVDYDFETKERAEYFAKTKNDRIKEHGVDYEIGGQLEMKFLKGGKLESKIQKKVDEVNSLIEKAIDSDGDPIMVVDKSGTWEEPMIYKPVSYRNGRLYFEYYEPYSDKTKKEVVNKSNIDFDGYPMLLDIAKMYRSALKQKGVSFGGGGSINKEIEINSEIEKIIEEIKSKGKYEKGKESVNVKGQKYRWDFYKLENPSYFLIKKIDSIQFKNYGQLTLSNSFDYRKLELTNNKDITIDRPTYKGQSSKFVTYRELVLLNEGGGKTTFKEKATAIAKNFEGKKVEPKYQKEYGKTYDKAEAKEVGNKIAGSQKAKYDSKMSGGGKTKRGGAMLLAKQIRKDGESWQSALKRANEQMRNK